MSPNTCYPSLQSKHAAVMSICQSIFVNRVEVPQSVSLHGAEGQSARELRSCGPVPGSSRRSVTATLRFALTLRPNLGENEVYQQLNRFSILNSEESLNPGGRDRKVQVCVCRHLPLTFRCGVSSLPRNNLKPDLISHEHDSVVSFVLDAAECSPSVCHSHLAVSGRRSS